MEEKITAWVARDENNDIHLFRSKPPIKSILMWSPYLWKFYDTHNYKIKLTSSLFPQVKWEDKEPTKVELTIKICE